MMPVEIIFYDVDGGETKVGPFRQVCFDLELIERSIVAVIRDAITRDVIATNVASFWQPIGESKFAKHVFVQDYDPERS